MTTKTTKADQDLERAAQNAEHLAALYASTGRHPRCAATLRAIATLLRK